jgi:osmotically-inducible protein OsmY
MNDRPVCGDPDRSRSIGVAAMRCLRNSPYLDVRSISCECKHGVLFLQGRLSSFHRKQVAQEAVAGVEGVDRVRNEITVG